MTITFKDAIAMATWINQYTDDERYQELLMLYGIRNNYTIIIPNS